MGDKSLTRSAYGVQKYRPEEIKEQWREYVRVSMSNMKRLDFREKRQQYVRYVF